MTNPIWLKLENVRKFNLLALRRIQQGALHHCGLQQLKDAEDT